MRGRERKIRAEGNDRTFLGLMTNNVTIMRPSTLIDVVMVHHAKLAAVKLLGKGALGVVGVEKGRRGFMQGLLSVAACNCLQNRLGGLFTPDLRLICGRPAGSLSTSGHPLGPRMRRLCRLWDQRQVLRSLVCIFDHKPLLAECT